MTDHTDCNHEDEQVIYILFDGEEEEVACDVLGIFEVEDNEYIALVPQDNEDDVLLYGFEEDADGEVNLTEIETDDEYEKVALAFEQEFFDEDEENEEE